MSILKTIFACGLVSVLYAQSVSTVENFGIAPAVAVYNGLGFNLTPENSWEYAASRVIHATWGRFDCGWNTPGVEIQVLPANVSGGFTFPSVCANALGYGATYGVRPIIDALYSPPYSTVVTGMVTATTSSGSYTIPITVTTGSLSSVVIGQSGLNTPSNNFPSSATNYWGDLIVGLSGGTLTLASALTSPVSAGTSVIINLLLYSPVLIANGTVFESNSSVQAYANYAHYLATQIAASGQTGIVSLWNEPTWSGDRWDYGAANYDSPPSGYHTITNVGVELPFMVTANAVVPGVKYDNGYTEHAGVGASLLNANTWKNAILPNLKANFWSEDAHPYGNNPEDPGWYPACVVASLTPATFPNIKANCTPIGLTGADEQLIAATSMLGQSQGGLQQIVTETGLCRNCTSPNATETQVTRFDMRQFLMFQGLGTSPIVFYRLYGDTAFQWLSAQNSPLPVYTAFQSYMNDLAAIANSPVTSYPVCMVPKVIWSNGYYPLAVTAFVGSRTGDSANSWIVHTWQRSYAASGSWVLLTSPSAVNVSINIPTGLQVSYVKDAVTFSAVTYSVSSGVLTYAVADDPIYVLLVPVAGAGPQLICN